MKRFSNFLLLGAAITQLCVALLLGVYSLGIGTAEAHMQNNFLVHKQELQKASREANTPEAQAALNPATFALADDGYKSAAWAESLSDTVFFGSILFFGFACFQLWAFGRLNYRKDDQ